MVQAWPRNIHGLIIRHVVIFVLSLPSGLAAVLASLQSVYQRRWVSVLIVGVPYLFSDPRNRGLGAVAPSSQQCETTCQDLALIMDFASAASAFPRGVRPP